jgi:hypothetical protein
MKTFFPQNNFISKYSWLHMDYLTACMKIHNVILQNMKQGSG